METPSLPFYKIVGQQDYVCGEHRPQKEQYGFYLRSQPHARVL